MSEEQEAYWQNHILENYKDRFERGDKTQILHALAWCIGAQAPVPAWLKQAFCEGCFAARMYEIASWEDVFGRPLKKGKRLGTARRNLMKSLDICDRVEEWQNTGKPIDDRMFAAIGKDLGIGSSTVTKDLYYETKNEIDAIGNSTLSAQDLEMVKNRKK